MSSLSQFGSGIKSIQRSVIALLAGAQSGTATITAVNTAKTELRYLGVSVSSATTTQEISFKAVLTNSTTITVSRGDAVGNAANVSVEVTEFY